MSIISIDKINEVLEREDKKNPFSDEKIASIIGTNREKVTEIRLKNNIQDSRERRKQFILVDGEKIIKADIEVSDRSFTKQLNEMGYKLSRYVASKIKQELIDKIKIVSNCKIENNGNKNSSINEKENSFEKDELISPKEKYSFDDIIGSKGSLKVQISQAKAAILYPPNGLHTLVLGPSGVGKSHIVGEMYKFAAKSGNFKKDAPFIVFNCADYADNPQLLLSQLFGHVKGAFTGADSAKQGLVEKADGGILFIDEVHRLPSKGQEILFYLLDKGMYRRLGETESNRKANIMLIGATTEDPASYLLLTFRRRIPMVIEIPAINERPFSERYEIIKEFYLDESFRIGKTIEIDPEAIRALMLYDCPGNIGQLRSDIQVACARGFLTSRINRDTTIQIGVCDLPNYVRNGLFIVDKKEEDADRFLNYSLIVNPNRSVVSTDRDDRYVFTDKIYQFIEERFNDLEKKGLTQEEINNIIGKQVEVEIKRSAKDVNSCTSISKINLKEIVGEKILAATYSAIEIAKDSLNNLHENLYYSLAIHLSATYERLKSGKMIINPQLKTVIREYPLEYKIAKVMSKSIEAKADNLLKDIINQDIIICDLEAKSKSDAIDALVELLEIQGYVDKEFMLSVYKRETMGATVLKNGIAIPHGEASHVTKPAIAIAKLSKSIDWEGNNEADIVFMIALKEDSKIYFNDLYKIISSEDGRKAIRTAKTSEEIMNAIAKFTIVTM